MRTTFRFLAVALALASTSGVAAQNPDELARRHYELGLGFLETKKYTEALKDFQMVVDSYPSSSVAGDALLEIAQYHLDIARDPAEAQKAIDVILRKYSSTSSAASAYVVNGRIAIARGRAAADVDTALASFERVAGLFPGSDAIPSSIYYAGEALRLVRRHDEALEHYRNVTLKYPRSPWSARALISAAVSLTQTGRPIAAIEGLQRVRSVFPGSPEALTALKWNTILYRLYVRAPAQTPYVYAGRNIGSAASRFRDVAALTIDAQDNVLLAHRSAVSIFDAKGGLSRAIPAAEPSAIAVAPDGAPAFIRESSLVRENGRNITLLVPQTGGAAKPVEKAPSVLAGPTGSWFVADRENKAIQIFSADGAYERPFVSTAVDRFAMNTLGDVAVLDRDSKTIAIFDQNSRPIARVPAKGEGYALDEPVDVAFDALGNLYVLDRGRGAVVLFTPQAKFLATFSIAQKAPGAFLRPVAFGLDSAARLYIFDERAEYVLVYQ
jgi:TolA-binding protein